MDFFEITPNPTHTLLKLKNGFQMVIENNIIKITSNVIRLTSEQQLNNYDFKYSEPESCSINNIIIESPNFTKILNKIYSIINDGFKIKETPTTFNLKIGEYKEKGFNYLSDIGISYQGKDANGTIREIYRQSKHHNILISIKIKLSDNRIIQI